MLKSRQNQDFSDIQTPSKTMAMTEMDRSDTSVQEASHQQVLKGAEQHNRSRSLTSLQSMFTRRKRPSLKRPTSQLSAHRTTALSACTSPPPSSTLSSSSSKESTFNKILHLLPFKGNDKYTLSLANTSALPSQKSLEFEALLEEYPSRTIKTSLTPCTAA